MQAYVIQDVLSVFSRSDNQEFSHLLWNTKVHCNVYNTLPPVPALSQINPIHTTTHNFPKIHFNHPLCLGLQSGLFLSGFPTKIFYAFIISLMRDICPVYLILLDIIRKSSYMYNCRGKLWHTTSKTVVCIRTMTASISAGRSSNRMAICPGHRSSHAQQTDIYKRILLFPSNNWYFLVLLRACGPVFTEWECCRYIWLQK